MPNGNISFAQESSVFENKKFDWYQIVFTQSPANEEKLFLLWTTTGPNAVTVIFFE